MTFCFVLFFQFLYPGFMSQRGKEDHLYKHFIKQSLGQKPVPAARKAQRDGTLVKTAQRAVMWSLLPASPRLSTTDGQVLNTLRSFHAASLTLPRYITARSVFLTDQWGFVGAAVKGRWHCFWLRSV